MPQLRYDFCFPSRKSFLLDERYSHSSRYNFLDSKSQIVNFVTAEPEPNVPDNKLILFQSKSPANFAIEIPAGTIQKLNLTPGDQINLYGL